MRISSLVASGVPVACYEAALLVEKGLADTFRPLVVVSAPESLQLARATARDEATAEEIAVRIRAQMPLEEKLAQADYVIENTGSLEALEAAALDVLAKIRALDA